MMARPLILHDDRLFPADPNLRPIARELYGPVQGLPIISPHGHTDPAWFATNAPFTNAAELLLAPDHYLYRMLYSQGLSMEVLGVPNRAGHVSANPRAAWRLLAENFHLFRGTPSSMWLNYVFSKLFGLEVALDGDTADLYFDNIGDALASAAFRPRALFERFNIELLATTETPSRHPRQRLEGPRRHRLSPRSGRRSRA
jgi:glucuronate isomerase